MASHRDVTGMMLYIWEIITKRPYCMIAAIFRLRQKVSAIYRLGAHRFHQGINKRPSFPFQSEVVDILQKSVSCGQTDGLSATPSVDCVRRQEEVAKGTWQFRVDKAKLAMKRVRAKRLLCS